MHILFAASEMVPFCKTGGLADVIGSLPPVIAAAGHDVSVMLPGYSTIDRQRHGFTPLRDDLSVTVGGKSHPLTLSAVAHRGVTVYLLENPYFYHRPHLYTEASGDYPDNDERFLFYANGVLETVKALGMEPDLVHAHDWQAGMVPALMQTTYSNDPLFSGAATLFTIHNLGYQGIFPYDTFLKTAIPHDEFHWTKLEYWGSISFLKAGIVYADAVSTVSSRYAAEITTDEYGFGMQAVLESRKRDLHGITNGIDIDTWNPHVDDLLPMTYGLGDMHGKRICREKLLVWTGLTAKRTEPVIGMVTRLDNQKGLDILEGAAERCVDLDARLVILGTGTEAHHDALRRLMRRFPEHIHVTIGFDETLAHMIYGGADAFLMPSRYEPCGLGQLIAMRYGTLPIVRKTGGLADTVTDLDEHPKSGTGFVFGEYTSDALLDAVGRCVKAFGTPGKKRWNGAVKRAMSRDSSWDAAGRKYVELYGKIAGK